MNRLMRPQVVRNSFVIERSEVNFMSSMEICTCSLSGARTDPKSSQRTFLRSFSPFGTLPKSPSLPVDAYSLLTNSA